MVDTLASSNDVGSTVWWGTKEDLGRIIRLIQTIHEDTLVEAQRKLAEAKYEAQKIDDERIHKLAKRIAPLISSSDDEAERKSVQLELHLGSYEFTSTSIPYELTNALDSKFLMTIKEKTWTLRRTGEPSELLNDLNENEVVSIELGFRSKTVNGLDLKVTLDKSGSNAVISGPQSQVAAAVAQLKAELSKQSSRLRWFYNLGVQVVFSLIISGAINTLLFLRTVDATFSAKSTVFSLLFLVSYVALTLATPLFPRFEIYREGKSKVKKLVGGIFGALLAGSVAIIANTMTGSPLKL